MFTREDFEKVGIDTSKIRNGKGVCPKCGTDRKNKRDLSLYVNYNDGVYKCFNHPCDFKGSVAFKKRDFVKKEFIKPVGRLQKVSDGVVRWFEERRISNNTLLRFGITESAENFGGERKKAICFNYFKDGKLVNIKFRSRDKQFKLVGGAELCLYNIDALDGESEAVIVEGELDNMAVYESGIYNCVSVPNGAQGNNSRLEYIDNSWEKLEKIEKFIIAVDDDEAGRSLKEALMHRLGVDNCWFIKYPPDIVVPDEKADGGMRTCKDLNEVLIYLGKEKVKQVINSAEQLPIVGAFQIMDVADELIDIYQKGQTQGDTTQYGELDRAFKWKKKELNLWAGYGNYGKTSMFLHLAMIKSMYDGWKWAIFSPENFPASDFFVDLIEMFVGKQIDDRYNNKMSEEEYAEAIEFIQDHIIYVYPPDVQNIGTVHDTFKKLHRKHGLDGVVIDPFNQLDDLFEGNNRDDQILSVMLKEMKRFALMNNLSYNVIAHPKNVMPDKEGKRPPVEVWHLAGGAMWNNKMDNILTVERPEWWRDKSSNWTQIRTHKIKRRRTGGQAGHEVDFTYLSSQSNFCLRESDKLILDKKRAEDYRADKDFYINELRRVEKMGLQKGVDIVNDVSDDFQQGNLPLNDGFQPLDGFEGF